MNRRIFYCKSWFIAHKKATELWTEQQAKKVHEENGLYTALIDSTDRPFCFINLTRGKGFAGVCFLDEKLRNYLEYKFKEVEPGRLFLATAIHRNYLDQSDTISWGSSFMFKPDGKVHMRKEYFNPHKLETADTTADVSGNYTPFPEFGEYDDLIRKDR
jgi:hypothetical protein